MHDRCGYLKLVEKFTSAKPMYQWLRKRICTFDKKFNRLTLAGSMQRLQLCSRDKKKQWKKAGCNGTGSNRSFLYEREQCAWVSPFYQSTARNATFQISFSNPCPCQMPVIFCLCFSHKCPTFSKSVASSACPISVNSALKLHLLSRTDSPIIHFIEV